MFEVTKEIKWCMGHRLTHGYQGKCRNLHGHSYKLLVSLKSPELNHFGMVVDFGDIKKLIEAWLMDSWDHAILVDETDTTLINFLCSENQRYYIISDDCNTTAEWMSKFLYHKTRELLDTNGLAHIGVSQVVVYETDTSYATYKG